MSLTFEKFEKVFNKVLLLFLASIIIWFLVSILTKQKVDLKNSTELEVHFKEIVKAKIEGKISYYYDLHTQDNDDVYRIAADNVDCFDVDTFIQNTEAGSLIKVYIDDKGLTKPSVIGIVSGGENYIDRNCINRRIEDDKLYIPLIFIIPAAIILILYYLKKRKTKKVKELSANSGFKKWRGTGFI